RRPLQPRLFPGPRGADGRTPAAWRLAGALPPSRQLAALVQAGAPIWVPATEAPPAVQEQPLPEQVLSAQVLSAQAGLEQTWAEQLRPSVRCVGASSSISRLPWRRSPAEDPALQRRRLHKAQWVSREIPGRPERRTGRRRDRVPRTGLRRRPRRQ